MTKTKLIPFDIEKAKNGAKVVTRNGLPVKIVDYPIKNEEYPILGLALIEGKEIPLLFTKTGSRGGKEESDYDLFIKEEVEEDDDYDPYKATVEYIADMVKRYSELQSIEELKDFYNNVRVKCQDAFDYGKVCMINQDEEPADNKPKFKVGDWIVQENVGVYKVTEIWDSWYEVIDSHELHYSIGFDQESMCHLWSIKDAKDGDVLHSIGLHNDCIFIFDRLDNWKFDADGDRAVATGYCCISIAADKMEFGIQGPDCIEVNTVKPATKKQRDLLFLKMKEAGYVWDPVKKELKIEKVKTRRMTHRELAWWLRDKPEEHRELKMSVDDPIIDSLYYYDNETNETVNKDIIIRRNGGEWIEPLIEEMED